MAILRSFDSLRLGTVMMDSSVFIQGSGVLKNSASDTVYYGEKPITVRRKKHLEFICKLVGRHEFEDEIVTATIYSSTLNLFSFSGRVSSVYNQLEDITYLTVKG